MRRLFSFFLFATLFGGYAMAYDFSAVCESGQTLYYNITSNAEPYTVEVTDGGTVDYPSYFYCKNLIIPSSVSFNGILYSVTSIGHGAFEICYDLTSITIPSSVTSIGNSAFYGCSGLTEITIPNSVTSIGGSAFSGCSGLTSVTIPNSVTNIGWGAFYNCSGLISVSIPSSVTSIAANTFTGTGWYNNQPDGILYLDGWCLGYKGDAPTGTLTINEGTRRIAHNVFSYCEDLVNITIPNSVINIGYGFHPNTQLTFANDNTNFRIVDDVLFDYEMTRIIMLMNNFNSTSYTIPNTVMYVDDYAFYNRHLTSVTIPNSVVSIGDAAFDYCYELTSVYYTGNIEQWCGITFSSITSNPLYSAHNLYINNNLVTELNIPESVTEIKANAFNWATCLTSITIPSSVTSIGNSAFYGCSGLTEITIPNSVTSIGGSAFSGCSGLTSVTIGNSVTSIGWDAFGGCGLTSVYYTGNVAQWCEIDFRESYMNPLGTGYNLYINNNLVIDLSIPDTITKIKNWAFSGATCLTSVSIPSSVTGIGERAFRDCSGITSVTISNSVTNIGEYAFSGCSGLTSVTIPNSITKIGWGAFSYCSGLLSVSIPNSVRNMSNPFEGTGWFNNQPDGILYLDGWCLGYKGERPTGNLVLQEGTKMIADYAFCEANTITSISIPNSVTNIGYGAFLECRELRVVTIGDSVSEIGAIAFGACENLDSVSIGRSTERIDYGAFSLCPNLKSVSIKSPVPAIDCSVFSVDPFESMPIINKRLYVNCGARETYVTSDWADWFTDIMEMPDCAGVEENEFADLQIYPNPVSNTLNITSSEIISEIEIVNVMGQVVRRIEVNSDNAVCDVEELTSGVYMVRIRTASATLIQRRFIKE